MTALVLVACAALAVLNFRLPLAGVPTKAAAHVACGSKCGLLGCMPRKCCPPGSFGLRTNPTGCSFFEVGSELYLWRCKKEARDPECTPCRAGTYQGHVSDSLSPCPQCPEGSASREGSTSRFDCTCREDLHYYGPAGGPCEIDRDRLRSKGIVWLFGNDSYRGEMARAGVGASVEPWPESLRDSGLTQHSSTWPWEAARFWGDQGPRVEEPRLSGWSRRFWRLVLREHSYRDRFRKDATGLGAWVEALHNVSVIEHPTRKNYRRIGDALDEWRLGDAAQYLSQASDGQGREVWPSTVILSNALVFHDGVVDAPIDVPLLRKRRPHRLAATKRFVFKGCMPGTKFLETLMAHDRLSLSNTSVPHYPRVASLAQHFGAEYFHFMVEVLVRVPPLLSELRQAAADEPSRLRLHLSASANVLAPGGFVGEFLALLGVPSEAVITGAATAETLLVPEPAACGSASGVQLFLARRELWRHLPVPLGRHDSRGSPAAAGAHDASRGGADSGQHQDGGRCQMLLLRRVNTLRRAASNAKELHAMVLAEASAFGCTFYEHHGQGPVREQLARFSSASVVVGVHGAGLSNIIVMPPGGLVLEIMPLIPMPNVCYMDLAVKLKLRYSAVLHLAADMEDTFTVEVSQVQKMLRLFPPVGARTRQETAVAWASRMSPADARAALAQTAHVTGNVSFQLEDDKRRRQREEKIKEGWAQLQKTKDEREKRKQEEDAEFASVLQRLKDLEAREKTVTELVQQEVDQDEGVQVQ